MVYKTAQALELPQGQLGNIRPHHKPSNSTLPSPDSGFIDGAYQDFLNTIFAAAKPSILRCFRSNYRP